MKPSKILTYGVLAFGGLMAFSGAALAVMYILEAMVARAGEADQSLLFWYLPILLIGLMSMGIGIGAGAWGVNRLRKVYPKMPLRDIQKSAATDSNRKADS